MTSSNPFSTSPARGVRAPLTTRPITAYERLAEGKPEDFDGSDPEWVVQQVLIQEGLTPGEDFHHQSPFFSGRIDRGGVVVDFIFENPYGLGINIQGVYWHYQQGGEKLAQDRIGKALLAQQGITLIFIDEDDLIRDPYFYVREALAFREHSKVI